MYSLCLDILQVHAARFFGLPNYVPFVDFHAISFCSVVLEFFWDVNKMFLQGWGTNLLLSSQHGGPEFLSDSSKLPPKENCGILWHELLIQMLDRWHFQAIKPSFPPREKCCLKFPRVLVWRYNRMTGKMQVVYSVTFLRILSACCDNLLAVISWAVVLWSPCAYLDYSQSVMFIFHLFFRTTCSIAQSISSPSHTCHNTWVQYKKFSYVVGLKKLSYAKFLIFRLMY